MNQLLTEMDGFESNKGVVSWRSRQIVCVFYIVFVCFCSCVEIIQMHVVGTRRVDGRVFFCLFGGGDDNVP